MKIKLGKVFMVLTLTILGVLSVTQISTNSVFADTPKCVNLACDDGADCGSKCFCNNPGNKPGGGTCVEDTVNND